MPGQLIIAGGSVCASAEAIYSPFIEAAGGDAARLAVFPGDGGFANTKSIIDIWEKMGICPDEVFVCGSDDFAHRLDGVTGFWFSDGSMRYILKNITRKALQAVRGIHARGGAIGGFGAGAAVMSEAVIAGGDNLRALTAPASWGYGDYSDKTKDNLRLAGGLGFFPKGVIDRQFDSQPRFFRLLEATMLTRSRKNALGFGIFDDTAIVADGDAVTVVGSGSVYILDLSRAARLGKPGEYVYSGVSLAVLNGGDTYDMRENEYTFAGGGVPLAGADLKNCLSDGALPMFAPIGKRQCLASGQDIAFLTDTAEAVRTASGRCSFYGIVLNTCYI